MKLYYWLWKRVGCSIHNLSIPFNLSWFQTCLSETKVPCSSPILLTYPVPASSPVTFLLKPNLSSLDSSVPYPSLLPVGVSSTIPNSFAQTVPILHPSPLLLLHPSASFSQGFYLVIQVFLIWIPVPCLFAKEVLVYPSNFPSLPEAYNSNLFCLSIWLFPF